MEVGNQTDPFMYAQSVKMDSHSQLISISERGETPPTQTKIRDTYKCVHGPQLGADPLFGKQCTNTVIYRERHRELQAEADHLIQLAQLSSACVRGEKWLDSV